MHGQNGYGYGGAMGAGVSTGKGHLLLPQRRRVNMYSPCIALFIPWGLFCGVYAAVTFSIHYTQPLLCLAIVVVALLAVLSCASHAWQQRFHGIHQVALREPSWMMFIALSLALAWLLGIGAGQLNYSNMLKYFRYHNLNSYVAVHPDTMRGETIMDVGVITFAEGSFVDASKSMGFRHEGMYCAAPISMGNATLANYDFWAVGKECCTSSRGSFSCGNYKDPVALGGLRVLSDDDVPFYRLAVRQAEATFNIRTVHPLFFHWVRDAPATADEWGDEGLHVYLQGVFVYFSLQAVAVLGATFAFSKLAFV